MNARRDVSVQSEAVQRLLYGRCGHPGHMLGPRAARVPAESVAGGEEAAPAGVADPVLRVFIPGAVAVHVVPASEDPSADGPDGAKRGKAVQTATLTPLDRVHARGLFEGASPAGAYRLRVEREGGSTEDVEDPYRFAPSLDPSDVTGFLEGTEYRADRLLGSHRIEHEGVAGVRFAVWAPRAAAVNLVGGFNRWSAGRHPMRPVGDTGVWELFLPGIGAGALYKFDVRTSTSSGAPGPRLEKADPFARASEIRPATASVVTAGSEHEWRDGSWIEQRTAAAPPRGHPGGRRGNGKAGDDDAAPPAHALQRPISIYEVHAGSWRRTEDGSWLTYRDLADTLVPYVVRHGFTHIEFLPLTEHPDDRSWGYQATGYFAATSRFGSADDLRFLIDTAHAAGIGVILDWVPGHFPRDPNGLARFDGQPLFEYGHPLREVHPDWGTAVFDYSRPEVTSFLVSSALYWIEEFHVDGLRVDAVASMLYRDYSRRKGEWEPNEEGGREDWEAVDFLRTLNDAIHERHPGVLTFAEESTTWPGLTRPTGENGLGFDIKWNMGWMNDTLAYIQLDPLARPYQHHKLTFPMQYAYEERYVLPLSHDEVVHLKRALLSKMPGGYDDKFAGLRALLGYMWAHPGRKLLFMGGELAQWAEWSEQKALDWNVLGHPAHRGVQRWVRALNQLYRETPALHLLDDSPAGFEWMDVHDAARNVISFVRWTPDYEDFLLVVANFAGTAWPRYRVAVPRTGEYQLTLNSDAPEFGGAGRRIVPYLRDSREEARSSECVTLTTSEGDYLGRPGWLELTVPALSFLFLCPTPAPLEDVPTL